MKRVILFPTVLLLIICMLCSCSKDADNGADTTAAQTTEEQLNIDLDLTEMSSTMIYSQVSNMMTDPEQFEGKIVKMKGSFSVYTDMEQMKNYYACIIKDATACCQQGMEFSLKDKSKMYPQDFPALYSEIEVVGRFRCYYEGSTQYCELADSTMTVL